MGWAETPRSACSSESLAVDTNDQRTSTSSSSESFHLIPDLVLNYIAGFYSSDGSFLDHNIDTLPSVSFPAAPSAQTFGKQIRAVGLVFEAKGDDSIKTPDHQRRQLCSYMISTGYGMGNTSGIMIRGSSFSRVRTDVNSARMDVDVEPETYGMNRKERSKFYFPITQAVIGDRFQIIRNSVSCPRYDPCGNR